MTEKDTPQKKTKKRKPYRPPQLTEYGSVKQFTRTLSAGNMADGAPGVWNLKKCVATVSVLDEHRALLIDREMQELFRQAIFQAVKPGMVVLDLGSGSGLHAMFACQAGARRVYAIERDAVIELAEEAARQNGFGEQIQFVYGLSTEVSLPEQVDLIISNTGFIGLVESLPDACARFLKPGGQTIPRGVEFSFAPVEDRQFFADEVEVWSSPHFGFDFSAFRDYAANKPQTTHFSPEQFLAKPWTSPPLSYSAELPVPISWEASFRVSRDGTISGIGGWYSFLLGDGIRLSMEPPLRHSPKLWRHPFFPLEQPVAVRAGEQLQIALELHPRTTFGEPIWRWTLAKGDATRSQTNFTAMPISQRLLEKFGSVGSTESTV